MRQLGYRQGNFKVSYSISLHVEEMSTGKLPFASVMNCSLSQIQNKEVTNCLPAGREKPRNPVTFEESIFSNLRKFAYLIEYQAPGIRLGSTETFVSTELK